MDFYQKINKLARPLLLGAVIFVTCYNLLLAFVSIDHVEIWCDEIYSLFISAANPEASQDWVTPKNFYAFSERQRLLETASPLSAISEIATRLSQGETHPPFYYWSLNIWMNIFGASPAALRGMSFFFAFLCLFIAFFIGTHIAGKSGGLLSLGVVGSSYHLLLYSVTARMHILTLFFALWLLYSTLRLSVSDRRRDYFLFCGGVCLGLLNSFVFLFFVLGALTYLLYQKGLSQRVLVSLFSICAIYGLYLFLWGGEQLLTLPYGEFSQGGGFRGELLFYEYQFSVQEFLRSLLHLSFIPSLHPSFISWGLVLITLVAPFFFSSSQKYRPLLLMLVAFPVLGLFFFDLLSSSYISVWGGGRAINFVMASFLLSSLLFLERFKKNIFVTLGVIALIGLNVSVNTHHAKNYFLQDEISYRDMSSLITSKISNDQSLLIVSDHSNLRFHYPLKSLLYFSKQKRGGHLVLERPQMWNELETKKRFNETETLLYLRTYNSFWSEGDVQERLDSLIKDPEWTLVAQDEIRGSWGTVEHYDWFFFKRD